MADLFCQHRRLRTVCAECRPDPKRDFLRSMGDVVPHALSEQVAQGTIRRSQLAQVEPLGERGPQPPLRIMELAGAEYWHAHDRLYPGGSQRSREWTGVREKMLERDHHRCCVCGSTQGLQVDHILPLAQGGANSYRNLWTLCRDCHSAKTGRNLQRTRLAGSQREAAERPEGRDPADAKE